MVSYNNSSAMNQNSTFQIHIWQIGWTFRTETDSNYKDQKSLAEEKLDVGGKKCSRLISVKYY